MTTCALALNRAKFSEHKTFFIMQTKNMQDEHQDGCLRLVDTSKHNLKELEFILVLVPNDISRCIIHTYL